MVGSANDPRSGTLTLANATAADKARAIYAARRGREELFRGIGGDLFGEPAWDLLLDLFVARQKGQLITVSNACIAASVPTTTALRWIAQLERQGVLVRTPDASDGRRFHVALSDHAADLMNVWLFSWT